jgi:membrane protease YdiL (CAAX protease family)
MPQLMGTSLGGTAPKILRSQDPADIANPRTGQPAPIPLGARRALWIFVAYLITQFGVAAVVAIAIAIFYAMSINDPHQVALEVQVAAIIPATLAGELACAFVIFRMTKRSFPGSWRTGAFQPLGWASAPSRYMSASAALGLALALAYVILVSHVPPRLNQLGPLAQAAALPGFSRLGWSLLAVALAPPVEEFLFRGVLFQGLARSWGVGWSAAAVTILFVAVHLPEVVHYWPAIAAVGLVALATILVRLSTGSLAPAVAIHVAYNLGLVIVVYRAA